MNPNTLISDINEILIGYFLNNEKWYEKEAKAKYLQRIRQVTPENLERATGHAKVMAQEFLKYAQNHGYQLPIKGIYWTSRPDTISKLVKIKVDQTKNPTDILIQFSAGPSDGWLGISAKSTKGRGEIAFKNPGIGTVDKVLGTNIGETYRQQLTQAIAVLNLPDTDAKRKSFIRGNAKLKQNTEKLGTIMLAAMRDDLYNRLVLMKPKELFDYIVHDWMNAIVMFPPYVKITGQGKKPLYSATTINPIKNEKLDALATLELKLEKVGNESIGIMAANKKIMKMRFKFATEKLASSVMMSGEAW